MSVNLKVKMIRIALGLMIAGSGKVLATDPIITAAEELAAINDLAPAAIYDADTAIRLTGHTDPLSDMDSLLLGTASSSSPAYWYMDGSDNLIVCMSLDGVWRTYQANTIAASWSATTTVTLTENVNDGNVPGSAAYTVDLILTKTGAPADLTRDRLYTYLRASTVKALGTAAAGTALGTAPVAGTAAAGWRATARATTNGTTITAATLDPIDMRFSVAATTRDGKALTFTSMLSNLHTWNLATNSTTAKEFNLTIDGRSLGVSVLPAKFIRTTATAPGIGSALIYAWNNNPQKRYSTNAKSHLSTIPGSLSLIKSLLMGTPSGSIRSMLNSHVGDMVASSNFDVSDFTTTADTNKYGLLAFTSSALSDVTWSVIGSKVIANARVGTSGILKNFECSLEGELIIKDDTNNILMFTATDGDMFVLKSFDNTGLDTTAEADVPSNERDTLLALQLITKLSAVTTIAKASYEDILSAAL